MENFSETVCLGQTKPECRFRWQGMVCQRIPMAAGCNVIGKDGESRNLSSTELVQARPEDVTDHRPVDEFITAFRKAIKSPLER